MTKLETLLNQAPKTAAVYLYAAVKHIDEQFGEGFAKKNPGLVASFIETCSHDFRTMVELSAKEETLTP